MILIEQLTALTLRMHATQAGFNEIHPNFYATGQLAIFPQYLCHECASAFRRLAPNRHMLLASHHLIGRR
jgi:hypothetical protein